MKALVIADKNIKESYLDLIRENNVDLVISLGDFERSTLLPLEQVTNIPKVGVYGNHCSGQYMEEIGMMNLHMCTWNFGGLKFAGFQGCVRYKPGECHIMYTQEEAATLIANFPDDIDVIVTHCPPRGINDEDEIAHQGFDALRNYLDTHSPCLLLHGHTYPEEAHLITQYHNTRIEYVSGYKIVEI